MLTWFSEKAKWLIYIFIALIGIALLSMDFMSLQWNTTPAVATWDKKEVPIDQFEIAYKNAYDGKNDLTEAEKFQIRNSVLSSLVNERLLGEELEKNHIVVSDSEMVLRLSAMIESDPRTWIPNPEILKQFMDESGKLDQVKFRAAMVDGMKKGSPFFRYFEAQIRSQAAEQHLQSVILAGFHPTDLEAKYLSKFAANKARLQVLSAVVDSFPAVANESDLKTLLAKATPESLYVKEDLASFEVVAIPNQPSQMDINLAKENMDSAYAHLLSGQSFADVSFNWSEDSVARADSGRLGQDYQSLDQWVPEFASVVSALDSGKYSQPFKTRFGWHIALCEGKKLGADGKMIYKLRHILSKITIGADTHKEIQDKLLEVRNAVLNGQSLSNAAQSVGLKTEMIPWTPITSLGQYGYINGLAHFANPEIPTSGLEKIWNWSGSTQKDREPISAVLRGDKVFALAQLVSFRKKGDTCRGAYEVRARAQAIQVAKEQAAQNFLNSQMSLLGTQSASDLAKQFKGKLMADSIPMAIGMGEWNILVEKPSKAVATAFMDSTKWSSVFYAARGKLATIAKPYSIQTQSADEIQRALLGQFWGAQQMGKDHPAYADWKRSLWNQRSVKTFLEQHYKGEDL